MFSLIWAVLSSALISIVMRFTSDKVEGFPIVLGLGLVSGVLFLTSFILFQENTRKNGVVLSAIFMKLGLLVPMVVSIFLFKVSDWGIERDSCSGGLSDL